MTRNWIPDGFHTLTPYLKINGAERFIEFIQKTFDATIKGMTRKKDGRILNAEVKIGDSYIMVAELQEGDKADTGTFYLYTEDTDQMYERAIKAGATSVMEPTDQVYGDRNAGVLDEFGITWWIATHIRDVSEEEINAHYLDR